MPFTVFGEQLRNSCSLIVIAVMAVMPPQRRYPVLIAFLQQALLHHTDVAVELFDQCLSTRLKVI